MRELVLTGSQPVTDEHHKVVVSDMERIEHARVRVYRTFTRDSRANRSYCFVTTVKDIHLAIGLFTDTARANLAVLLEKRLLENDTPDDREIMVFESENRQKGVLVTLHHRSSVQTTFHLSAAH